MTFFKGHPQYNTGRTHFKKGHSAWHKGSKGLKKAPKTAFNQGHKPWNKGEKNIHLSPDTEFKKGIVPWNKELKGIHLSPKSEYKKGQRSLRKGKPFYQIKGKNHWNWQGGKTPAGVIIRVSLRYKNWRRKVFKRDDYTCQICFIKGGKLQVDHIKPFAYYPEARLDVNNGRVLCLDCHKKTDTYGFRGSAE
ncbi:MAG: HNH endonuclease [Nanoarchaeota archaeon]